jgi:ABC-type transport system involved in multi-copper enzyme maturation permease subunit
MTPSSHLLANWLDSLHIEISDGLVCAITPIWILGIGALAGLALCGVVWLVLAGLSRIPGLGDLAANKPVARVVSAVLAVIIFIGSIGVWYSLAPSSAPQEGAAAAAQGANAPAANQPGAGPNIFDRILLLGGLAVASWIVAVGIITLVSHRAVTEAWEAVTEGVLTPFAILVVVVAAIGIFGTLFVRKPSEMFESLARWPAMLSEGNVTQVFDIKAPVIDDDASFAEAIDVNFRRDEVRRMIFKADQHLKVATAPFEKPTSSSIILDLTAGEEVTWQRDPTAATPFPERIVRKLYVKNFGAGPAKLTITRISDVANPEMTAAPITALCILGVFLVYLLQRTALPKMTAVTLATAKTDFAQPVYVLVAILGVFFLLLFIIMPMNTFGKDIRGLKTAGFSLIPFLGLFVAIWSASTSLAEEIEGKTALTVLSKPVSRLDFILGKFSGIAWSTLFLCALLGFVLLVGVAYKPVYDDREGADYGFQQLPWQFCYKEMAATVPGLVLVYLQVVVMTAISVAISTRLPFIPNLLICFTIWALGHLTPQLVQSQEVAQQLPPIVFFSKLIATVFPVLDHFDVQASVAGNKVVPLLYIGWCFVYAAIYSTIAMLLALVLFEDRDLA